jgi:hypothetical protein
VWPQTMMYNLQIANIFNSQASHATYNSKNRSLVWDSFTENDEGDVDRACFRGSCYNVAPETK